MKQFFCLGLIALFFNATGCNKNDSGITFELGKSFIAGYNVQVPWENDPGITVRFNKTVEDSRCPIDAECIWAGRVVVEVTFTQGGNSETKSLALGDYSGSGYSNTVTFGNFSVELLNVLPAPKTSHQIAQDEYQLELVVRKE